MLATGRARFGLFLLNIYSIAVMARVWAIPDRVVPALGFRLDFSGHNFLRVCSVLTK